MGFRKKDRILGSYETNSFPVTERSSLQPRRVCLAHRQDNSAELFSPRATTVFSRVREIRSKLVKKKTKQEENEQGEKIYPRRRAILRSRPDDAVTITRAIPSIVLRAVAEERHRTTRRRYLILFIAPTMKLERPAADRKCNTTAVEETRGQRARLIAARHVSIASG